MQENKVTNVTKNEVSYVTGGGMMITLTMQEVQTNFAKEGTKISENDFKTFANLCSINKLNPYAKEVWFISTNGRPQIMIGKDGYFKMADSNPDYDGMEDGVIVSNKNGEIVELEGCFVPPNHTLVGGWAKVYSKNKKYPKVSKVSLEEYKGLSPLWKTKAAVMINKCAKTTALRDMFPQTYAGTYDESEISDSNGEIKTFDTKKSVVKELERITNKEDKKEMDLSFMDTIIHRENRPDLSIKSMIESATNLKQAGAVKAFFEAEAKNLNRDEAERTAIAEVLKGIKNGTIVFNIK